MCRAENGTPTPSSQSGRGVLISYTVPARVWFLLEKDVELPGPFFPLIVSTSEAMMAFPNVEALLANPY